MTKKYDMRTRETNRQFILNNMWINLNDACNNGAFLYHKDVSFCKGRLRSSIPRNLRHFQIHEFKPYKVLMSFFGGDKIQELSEDDWIARVRQLQLCSLKHIH